MEPVFVERVDDLADSLRAVLHDGDVVLTMGAGNIGAVAQDLKSRFAAGDGRVSAQRISDLSPEFASRVLHDVPMAKHTSWHVGGPADFFFTPRDAVRPGGLHAPAAAARSRCFGSGLGSNLLVRDGGIRGAVISTHGALGALERLSATRIRAEAGVPCARIARQCVKWGLGPAEFFAGIPGTLGGALAMNAGAWGGETWRHVIEVDVLDRARPAPYAPGRRLRGRLSLA